MHPPSPRRGFLVRPVLEYAGRGGPTVCECCLLSSIAYRRFRMMERREPRASRSGAWQPRRLAGWQLWDLARVASQARAAGDCAVKVHGVVIFFRHPERAQQGCGQQRTSAVGIRGSGGGQQRTSAVVDVDDAPTASSAKPAQLSKRKQRRPALCASRTVSAGGWSCAPLRLVMQQVVLWGGGGGAGGEGRRLPGDGWRDGTWLGCVRLSLRLSRAALWRPLRRRGSGGWTSALQCHRPRKLGW